MTLNEIKKLSRKEFAERYPFVQVRYWKRDKLAYELATYDEDCKEFDIKKDDPVLKFYTNSLWHGWSDLLLCWAEKVREVALEKDILNDFWVSDIKEKYGTLRIYLNYSNPEIDDLVYMAEHLSRYTCYKCGHIGRSSNEKKLVTYRSRGFWVSYQCRKCAKKESWMAIKDYGVTDSYFKKWLHSNPHFNLYKSIFDSDWKRETGDWHSRITSYYKGEESRRLLDCHKLFEGML